MKHADQREISVALARLRDFWRRMNEWESEAAAGFASALVSEHELDPERAAKFQSEALNRLHGIFSEYCLRRGPQRGLEFENPPEYDPNREEVLSVTPRGKSLIVRTRRSGTGGAEEFVYEMRKTADLWRIVGKRWVAPDGEEMEHGI